MKMEKENPMKKMRIEKLTLNVGAGKDAKVLEKGTMLLKALTGIDPVKTKTMKRLQAWGLRPGLPVGCKITIRDQDHIKELLPRLLDAKDKTLRLKMFDNYGNISFGIPECIDITDYKYDPKIGIMGLQVSLTLARPGYRVMRRRLHRSGIKRDHLISRDEAIDFMKKNYSVTISEEVDEE